MYALVLLSNSETSYLNNILWFYFLAKPRTTKVVVKKSIKELSIRYLMFSVLLDAFLAQVVLTVKTVLAINLLLVRSVFVPPL